MSPTASRRSVLFAGAASALAPGLPMAASAAVLPFVFEDERLYAPVRVDDVAAPAFILDSGAASCVLDRATARTARLRVRDRERVGGAGAGSSLMGHAGPVRLDVGPARLRLDQVNVLGLSALLGSTSGRAPGGIVGAPFFRERVVEVDFVRRELRLHDAKTDLASVYTASVPFDFFEDALPRTTIEMLLPSGRRLSAHVLVDLGAKACLLLPEPFIDSSGLRKDLGPVRTAPLGAGLGGPTKYDFTRIRRIEFAQAPAIGADAPIAGLSVGGTLRSTWHEGLLGAEFLSRFDLAFDYPRSRLLLRPRSTAPFVFDMSGLFLTAQGRDLDRIVVGEVLPDSPAAEAGFRPGDAILEIDGKVAGRLRLPAVREALKAGDGRTVELRYPRNGATRSVRLRLRTLL